MQGHSINKVGQKCEKSMREIIEYTNSKVWIGSVWQVYLVTIYVIRCMVRRWEAYVEVVILLVGREFRFL